MLSQGWEQLILQHIFKRAGANSNLSGGGMPASPAKLWFGLVTGGTDNYATALSLELSGNGYGRAGLDTDPNIDTHTNWNAITAPGATSQQITNKVDIVFPTATGSWNGGSSINLASIWTVQTGGTADQFLGLAFFVSNVVILTGNTLRFQGGTPGFMKFTIN